MGHYYADMFPKGEDPTFYQRYADYQRECAKEIYRITAKNPIKFEEIKLGDKLTLYAPLKGISKVKFDNKRENHDITDLFKCTAKYFGWEMGALSFNDTFVCHGKRKVIDNLEKKSYPQIRIDSPKDGFDFPQYWIEIKYFQKK